MSFNMSVGSTAVTVIAIDAAAMAALDVENIKAYSTIQLEHGMLYTMLDIPVDSIDANDLMEFVSRLMPGGEAFDTGERLLLVSKKTEEDFYETLYSIQNKISRLRFKNVKIK